MPDILILVDLANTTVFRGIHNPNPALVGARLDAFLGTLAERTPAFVPVPFPDLRIRLYDGWFDVTGRGTDLYQMVRRHIREAYPTRRRAYRVFVNLAEGPLATAGEKLTHTFRIQSGLTRHHLSIVGDPPDACARPADCAIAPLRSWVKGRCPVDTCAVTSDGAAYFRHQKLVDTALVSDLVWSGSRGFSVLVVSDDEDVLPGLITARAFGATVGWVGRTEQPREPYDRVIARHGIRYIAC